MSWMYTSARSERLGESKARVAERLIEEGLRGRAHHGLIYALDPPFNRHRGEGVIGQMVNALAHFLSSPDAAKEPFNRAHYLREAPAEE
jgi:hypothetical protein